MFRRQYQTAAESADLPKGRQLTGRGRIKDGELRLIDIGKGSRVDPNELDSFRQSNAIRSLEVTNSSAASLEGPSPSDAQPTAQTRKGQSA